LSIGQVLCVVSSSSGSQSGGCTTTYTVASGDYCSLIWTQFGLTEAQLRGLNPGLDASCDLSVGQVLCVQG
jgi:chitinase